jgi:hypothetical protein
MQKILFLVVALSLLSFVNINQQYPASFANAAGVMTTDSTTRTASASLAKQLYDSIRLDKYNLDFMVFDLAMIGYESLRNEGKLGEKNLVTIIDFTKPSTEKRFYTIDLDTKTVLFHSLVAHGRNTGENMAKSFSNRQHSNQSSLGFYITGESYVGSKGYSLRLDGQEQQFNSKLRDRAVVIHAADYVSEGWIKKYGRIGRSQGCPALPNEINKQVIDTIKDKTVVFAYFNDENYLSSSAYLNLDDLRADPTLNASGGSALGL